MDPNGSWIGLAHLDRLLFDRVEQDQREPEVVVPEGSPRVGSLPDPLESVFVTADVVNAVALAGVAPHGMPEQDPPEALDRLRRTISYSIAAGLDWKQISTWAGHGDVRQTWNRYGHLVPGGEEQARQRLDAFLTPSQPSPTVAHTVAHDSKNDETPVNSGVLKYRYRDSKPAPEV